MKQNNDKEKVDKILASAASAFGMSVDDIRSKSRKRPTCDARKAIVNILKKDLKKSNGQIAKSINKSHCTMDYMLKHSELLMKSDDGFKMRVNRIRMDAKLSTTCPCCGRPYEAD